MTKFIVIFYITSVSFAHWAWGSTASRSYCFSIKEELKQMRQAQSQISKNLLENYKTASEQVSYVAVKMHDDSPKQRLYVREQALRSAKAHKKRVEKTEVILHNLAKAVDELIKKTANCIK